MVEAGYVSDFVQQNGEQVDPAGSVTAGTGNQTVMPQGDAEFRGLAGRRVDEPAVTGGVPIDRNPMSIGLTEDTVAEVSNANFEICQALCLGAAEAGGGPDSESLFEDRGEGLIGESRRGILCRCSKSLLNEQVVDFVNG